VVGATTNYLVLTVSYFSDKQGFLHFKTGRNFDKVDSKSENKAMTSKTPEKTKSQTQLGYIYAIVAVIFFGSSAVLVILARPIPPLEITFWRLVIATIFIFVLLKLTHTALNWRQGSLRRFAIYGFVTALHFILYISSLSFTTVAHSLTLVNSAPIFVTILASLFLKESISGRKWLGIVIAVVGIGVLAGFESQFTTSMLIGDLMALGSGITYAIYSLIGRRERDNYSLFSYAFGVYGFAALWVLPVALWSFLGGAGAANYNLPNILALLALGIFPLGFGHTLYNASLRRIHATYANIIGTQEVLIGILYSWLFIAEVPSTNALIGAGITLVGLIIVLI
jgi:drug/metabolite transporter (DMT)-like permease